MNYTVRLRVDMHCQVVCGDSILCDTKVGNWSFSLSPGSYLLDFKVDDEIITTLQYDLEEDECEPVRLLKIELYPLYSHHREKQEALSKGESVMRVFESMGFTIIRIRLEEMCAVSDHDYLKEGEEFDFFKAVIEYTPQCECEDECPIIELPEKYRNRKRGIGHSISQLSVIDTCHKRHPDVRCKRKHFYQKKEYYPYFKCSHGQAIDLNKRPLKQLSDLIIYDGRWVAAVSTEERFIPDGEHFDSICENVPRLKFVVPQSPQVDLDWIEEHGWQND